jgi:hypothetical protein
MDQVKVVDSGRLTVTGLSQEMADGRFQARFKVVERNGSDEFESLHDVEAFFATADLAEEAGLAAAEPWLAHHRAV